MIGVEGLVLASIIFTLDDIIVGWQKNDRHSYGSPAFTSGYFFLKVRFSKTFNIPRIGLHYCINHFF